MHKTGTCQNRLQLQEISIAFKGSFQSAQLFHLLCKLLKADTIGRRECKVFNSTAVDILDKTVNANICKQGYKKVGGPQLNNIFK